MATGPAPRPFSLTTRRYVGVTEFEGHYDTGEAPAVGSHGYLIYSTDVRPDQLRRGTVTRWELFEWPGRTNMSHEVKLHGWLGTTSDICREAGGYVQVLRSGPRTVRVVETGWSRSVHGEAMADAAIVEARLAEMRKADLDQRLSALRTATRARESAMSPAQAKRRLCFPDGHLPSSRGRVRAVCHCGEVTTPRASGKLADEALSCEHGWFAAPDGCAICRQKYDDVQPWEAFTVLDDGEREVWVCQDTTACSDRHETRRSAQNGTAGSADSS